MSNFRFEQEILVMKYLTPHLALFQWLPSGWCLTCKLITQEKVRFSHQYSQDIREK
jgi:hypothetical protein